MRSVVAISALLIGLSNSAWAQQPPKQPAPAQSQTQSQSANVSPSSGNQDSALTEGQLRKDLEQAGFKNITVLRAAYLVEATSSDGSRVVLMINPPNFSAVEAAKPTEPTTGSTSPYPHPSSPLNHQ